MWSQTISYGRVASLDQLREACANHFQGRPCLGYPLDEDIKQEAEMRRYDYSESLLISSVDSGDGVTGDGGYGESTGDFTSNQIPPGEAFSPIKCCLYKHFLSKTMATTFLWA